LRLPAEILLILLFFAFTLMLVISIVNIAAALTGFNSQVLLEVYARSYHALTALIIILLFLLLLSLTVYCLGKRCTEFVEKLIKWMFIHFRG